MREEKLRVLSGRTLLFFPDADAYAEWKERADGMTFCKVVVSDLIEKNRHLVRIDTQQVFPEKALGKLPFLRQHPLPFQYAGKVMVSDLIEKNATPEQKAAHIDIADWIIYQIRDSRINCTADHLVEAERILLRMIEKNPALQKLIDLITAQGS